MAQDHLIFHTNDRVVTSTSLGNQEKWFDAEKNLWYKVDNGHFEALAEAMASEVLRRFTNAADLPGISIAHYWVDTADVHGLPQVLSVSENFKAGNESLITAHIILRNSLGRGYIQEFNDRNSLKERIIFLVDSVEAATGFSGFGAYFTTLLELDALFLNQDRHLNNIALYIQISAVSPAPFLIAGLRSCWISICIALILKHGRSFLKHSAYHSSPLLPEQSIQHKAFTESSWRLILQEVTLSRFWMPTSTTIRSSSVIC